MVNLRLKIETWFERYALYVYRRPIAFAAIVLIVTIALGSQLSRLGIDTSLESLLQPGDPALKDYNDFCDQFGRDDNLSRICKFDGVIG